MKDENEMTEAEFIFNMKYGLIVLREAKSSPRMTDILHFAGFVSKPTRVDIDELRKELSENEEFGLQGVIDECVIIQAPKEIVSKYLEIVK